MPEHLWARPRPVEDDEWQLPPAWPGAAAPAAAHAPGRAAADPDERVDPHPDRAAFGYRLGAVCIDLGAATAAAALAAAGADALGGDRDVVTVVAIVVWSLTWLAVTAAATELSGGATLGKLAAGLVVVHARDRRPIGAGASVVRDTLLRLLYLVPFFWLVDSAMASGDDRRALRDRMARTLVLRTPVYARRAGIVALAATIGVAGSIAAVGLIVREDLRVDERTSTLPGYDAVDRRQFLADCTRQDTLGMCTCLYAHVSTHLPYTRYIIGDVDRALRDAYDAC